MRSVGLSPSISIRKYLHFLQQALLNINPSEILNDICLWLAIIHYKIENALDFFTNTAQNLNCWPNVFVKIPMEVPLPIRIESPSKFSLVFGFWSCGVAANWNCSFFQKFKTFQLCTSSTLTSDSMTKMAFKWYSTQKVCYILHKSERTRETFSHLFNLSHHHIYEIIVMTKHQVKHGDHLRSTKEKMNIF